MQFKPRLFIGKHRELRRPENVVDESLIARMEEARRRLKIEGKDIKPVLTVRERQQQSEREARRRAFAQQVASARASKSAREVAS